jgi:transposase
MHDKAEIERQCAIMRQMREDGMSIDHIAEALGVSIRVVEYRFSLMIRRGEIVPRSRGQRSKITDGRLPEVIQLLGSGMSRGEAAKCFGVSKSVIDHAVWRAQALGIHKRMVPVAGAAQKVDIAAPSSPAPMWTEGRLRYLSVLRKHRTVLGFMPAELNREFPHLPRVTVVDVRNRIYGGDRAGDDLLRAALEAEKLRSKRSGDGS